MTATGLLHEGPLAEDAFPARTRLKYRWACAAVGILCVIFVLGWLCTVGGDCWPDNELEWIAKARQQNLSVSYGARCVIPGLAETWFAQFFSRREVLVLVGDTTEVEKLMSLPPCPMNVRVRLEFNSSLVRQQLIQRFGRSTIAE